MVDSIGFGRAFKARSLALLAALGLLAGSSSAAKADPMRYQFTGEASVNGVATPFSGTVTYDPTESTPFVSSSTGFKSTGYGNYWNVPGTTPDGSGMTLNVGGTSVINETGGLGVGVYEPSGTSTPLTGLSFTSTLGQPLQATLQFSNTSKAVFSSLDPPSTVNLSDFNGVSLQVYQNVAGSGGSTNQSILYSGTITSFTPVPAPEPSTVALLGAGALGYCLRARARRRAG